MRTCNNRQMRSCVTLLRFLPPVYRGFYLDYPRVQELEMEMPLAIRPYDDILDPDLYV